MPNREFFFRPTFDDDRGDSAALEALHREAEVLRLSAGVRVVHERFRRDLEDVVDVLQP